MAAITESLRRWSKDGWTATKTGGGHIRLTHPDAPTVVFAGSTPSDNRSLLNADSMLKRVLRRNMSDDNQKIEGVVEIKQKKKPARREISPLFVMDEPASVNRFPRRKWASDNDFVEVVDPQEIIEAWKFAYLRLRLEQTDIAVIRIMRQRYKSDETFRVMLLNSYRKASQDDFNERRTNPSSNSNIAEQTTQHHPIQTIPILPRYIKDEYIKIDLPDSKTTLLQQVTAERDRYAAEVLELRATISRLEADLSEARTKRLYADRSRDDMAQCLEDTKVLLRDVEKNLRAERQKNGQGSQHSVRTITVHMEPPVVHLPKIKETYGTRLKSARKARGLTQGLLGEIVGVSGPMICHWESDKYVVPQYHLPKILEALGISEDYLEAGHE